VSPANTVRLPGRFNGVILVKLRILIAVLLAALAASLSSASAEDPYKPSSFVIRSVFADGRLWILSDADTFSSLAKGDSHWLAEHFPDPVRDICVTSDGLIAVTTPRSKAGGWSLWRRKGDQWTELATESAEEEWPHGLHCEADRITLITNVRLISIVGETQTAIRLDQRVGSMIGGAYYGDADYFFVGVNNGEWGGGLQRIDRRLGTVTTIEGNRTGSLCGGPLNTKCDPVTGLTAAPWTKGCVVAAVGLAHLSEHGRLVEICGDQVERLYYRRQGRPVDSGQDEVDDRGDTTAFSSLVRTNDSLWAAGSDGIYRVRKRGAVEYVPLPKFQKIDGIEVSFDLPDVIVLMTEIDPCEMCVGSEPIVVAR
jgi:hypothetical protein